MPARLDPRAQPAHPRRAHTRNASRDAEADDETITFIKRTLCPTQNQRDGLENLLPPLTSSNQVDVELYGWVAVLLHQFVQSWYNRLTPDHQFVSEIVHIIAHCTRGLESRLRTLDFESLLADEMPVLLHHHVRAVRISQLSSQPRAIVNGLLPHVALTPVPADLESRELQAASEVAWCQLLISKILPLLLPPEDLENPCLKALVSEVMSQTIFYNAICGKVSEPWLLWDAISKVAQILQPRIGRKVEVGSTQSDASTEDRTRKSQGVLGRISASFWSLINLLALARILAWAFFDSVRHATIRLPRRRVIKTLPQDRYVLNKSGSDQSQRLVERRPIVQMGIWSCLSETLLLPQRMPWLTGAMSYLQWALLRGPGKLCDVDGALDRLLCAAFHTRVLPALAHSIPTVLRSARATLFPNNSLAAGRPVPTEDEVRSIKQNCVLSLLALIPPRVRHIYFATGDVEAMKADIDAALDVLGDQYMNKHLIVSLIDLLVVRLFPELTVAEDV